MITGTAQWARPTLRTTLARPALPNLNINLNPNPYENEYTSAFAPARRARLHRRQSGAGRATCGERRPDVSRQVCGPASFRRRRAEGRRHPHGRRARARSTSSKGERFRAADRDDANRDRCSSLVFTFDGERSIAIKLLNEKAEGIVVAQARATPTVTPRALLAAK
jgi:hypothetical protein